MKKHLSEKTKHKVLNELNRISAKVGLFCYHDYEGNEGRQCPCPQCQHDDLCMCVDCMGQ